VRLAVGVPVAMARRSAADASVARYSADSFAVAVLTALTVAGQANSAVRSDAFALAALTVALRPDDRRIAALTVALHPDDRRSWIVGDLARALKVAQARKQKS